MAQWKGECEFQNVQSSQHGSRLIETVHARKKADAEELLREAASVRLFKTPDMFRYIRVLSVSRVA